MSKFLGKAFGFDAEKHNVRTEIVAGITTFLTMAYILAVNPSIFSALDMPKGAVFTATALAALIGTLVMAFYAKKPFALAPGMGLNAFFVFTVCLTMGHSWQFALTAVFLEGLLFIILTLTKVRSWILNAIPLSLKHAIGAGIGLFIAFIGLQNAGIIANNDSTLVSLGDITHGAALLGIIGIVITGALVILKVKGSILIGILVTAIIGLFIKDPASGEALTKFSGVISAPDSVAPIFMKFEWSQILSWDMLAVVFTFLFIDMFDTMGTIKGNVDGIDKMFMADSIATVCGACLGTSTTTTYVESASGVGEGGRTGLTAFTVAILFALALLFSPIFLAIPGAATAPALVVVGVMMMSPVAKIDWEDYSESIPAFITVLMMPVAYSISDGILLGVISYVLLNACAGKFKKISPTMWVSVYRTLDEREFRDLASRILFEDNHLLVFNKRAGEIVQGDKTGDEPVSETLKAFIAQRDGKPGQVFMGVPHRLDRPVSGLVLFAKTSKALERLNAMFRSGEVHKTYWALCCGKPSPESALLTDWMTRNEKLNKSFIAKGPGGEAKEAKLKYTYLKSTERYHLVEVELLTGRHHQIRCQLAHIGCPIKGDLKYGAPRSNPDGGISLHARSIRFIHPVKKTEIFLEAPVPASWKGV